MTDHMRDVAQSLKVRREDIVACLSALKLETFPDKDDDQELGVTIVGHSRAADKIMALIALAAQPPAAPVCDQCPEPMDGPHHPDCYRFVDPAHNGSSAAAGELPEFEDPRVQIVYEALCDADLNEPPNRDEHWEGWVSRHIVKRLFSHLPQAAAVTDEMLNAHLRATGEWVEPYEAPRESGVAVDMDISQEDADEMNADARNSIRKGYEASLSLSRPQHSGDSE